MGKAACGLMNDLVLRRASPRERIPYSPRRPPGTPPPLKLNPLEDPNTGHTVKFLGPLSLCFISGTRNKREFLQQRFSTWVLPRYEAIRPIRYTYQSHHDFFGVRAWPKWILPMTEMVAQDLCEHEACVLSSQNWIASYGTGADSEEPSNHQTEVKSSWCSHS